MKQTLLSATACVFFSVSAMAGGHEHAQSTSPTISGQQSQLQGQAQQQAQRQGQGQRQTANAISRSEGGKGGRGGSGGNTGPITVSNTNGGGGGYSARGNTPDVILGSVSGGNPCGLGAGAGGSGPGAGGILSFMWEGEGCETREGAKLLYNMGYEDAAKQRLCQDTRYSTAFANAGQPCAADMARWQAAGYRQQRRQDGALVWVR